MPLIPPLTKWEVIPLGLIQFRDVFWTSMGQGNFGQDLIDSIETGGCEKIRSWFENLTTNGMASMDT
jgi:hypothetical protein